MALRFVLRIIAPTVGLGLLLLVSASLAAWYLHQLQRESSRRIAADSRQVSALEELALLNYRLRNHLTELLFTADRHELDAVPHIVGDAGRAIDEIRQMGIDPAEQALVGRIEQGYKDFIEEFDKIARDPNRQEHRQRWLTLIRRITNDEILAPVHEYQRILREHMSAASVRQQAITDRMGMGLVTLGLCAAVAGLVAGLSLAILRRSIVQLSIPIRDATGKLNEVIGPISVLSDPSFRGLETALSQLGQQVGHVVERLQESQRAAARAEQLAAVGQLAAGLAHELRNPLTSVKLLIQTAAEQDSQGLDSHDFEVLEDEIARLDRIIQTFLDYARPPRPQRGRFALQDAIRRTADFVAPRAAQLGVRIDCHLPEQSTTIDADEGQIRQVLLNLLLNALDVSRRGGAVEIGLRAEQPAVDAVGEPCFWARIDVADVGPGLPPDLGEKIFEPFISTKETGTGLGLAICKRIIEDHGGRIAASDRVGGGAVLSFWLPVAPAPVRPTEEVTSGAA